MTAPLWKHCENCGARIEKPPTCSLADWPKRRFCSAQCKAAAQVGVPSKKLGKHYRESRKKLLPCRICGGPTRYAGTEKSSLFGRVRCDNPQCAEASKSLKNAKISESHKGDYQSGKRRRLRENWRNVPRVSSEERSLETWFAERGWLAQHRVTLGISDVRLPRSLDLDFAQPDLKLNVEIDGTSHHSKERQSRDARRDRLLAERGWRTLRVAASSVMADFHAATEVIAAWIDHATMELKK